MHSATSLDRSSMTTGNTVPMVPSLMQGGTSIFDLIRVSQSQHQQLQFLPNLMLEPGAGTSNTKIEYQNDYNLKSIQGIQNTLQESSPTRPRNNSSVVQSEQNLFQQLTTNPPSIKQALSSSTPAQTTPPFFQISVLQNNNNNNMNNITHSAVTQNSIYPTLSSSNADTEKKYPGNESLFNFIPQLDKLQKGTNTPHFELFPQNNPHIPQIAQQPLLQQNQSQQQYIVHPVDSSQKLAQIPQLLFYPQLTGTSQTYNQPLQDPLYLHLLQYTNAHEMSKQSQNQKQNGLLTQQLPYFNSKDLYQQLIPTSNSFLHNPQPTLMASTCLLEDEEIENEELPMIKDEHVSASIEIEQVILNDHRDNSIDSSSSISSSNSSQSHIKEPRGQISSTLLSRRLNNTNGHNNQKTTAINRIRTASQNGQTAHPPRLISQISQGSPPSRPRSRNLTVPSSTVALSEEALDQPLNSEYTQHLLKQFMDINIAPFSTQSKYSSVNEGFSRIRQTNSLLSQLPLPDSRSSEFTNNLLTLTNSIQQQSLVHQNPQLIFGSLLNPSPLASRKTSDEPPMSALLGFSSPPVSIPRLPSLNEGISFNEVGTSMNNNGAFNLRSSLRKVQSEAVEFIQPLLQSEKSKEDILAKLNENRPRGVSFMSLPSTNNGFSPSRHASSRVSFLSVPTPVLQSSTTDERTLLNLYSPYVRKDIERSRQFGTAKNTSNTKAIRQRAESENLNNVPLLVEQSSAPQSKRSKYHNLTKLFMYFLLSLFSTENMLKLNIPKQIQSELIKCVQNVKKTAKKKIKNHNLQKTDFFNHTHYNVLFLHLNKNSLKELQKKEKDIDVHRQCFGIDLREIDEQRLEYVNILKKFAYEIVINTLESPAEIDCENNPRNEYMLKALSGIRQLAQGNAIFRFQQIYTGQNSADSPK